MKDALTTAASLLALCVGLIATAEPGPAPEALIVDQGEMLRIELLAQEFIGGDK